MGWGEPGLGQLLLKAGGWGERGRGHTMAPKTVLITGCSSGIGLALAVRLARDKQRRFRGERDGGEPPPQFPGEIPCGAEPPLPLVIATMRNVGRSGALAAAAGSALGRTLEIRQLDVCDEGSIRACLDGIPGRHVDVLGEPRDPAAPTASPRWGAQHWGPSVLGTPPCTGDCPHQARPTLGTLCAPGAGDPLCQG